MNFLAKCVTIYGDGTIRFWDAHTGKHLKTISDHTLSVHSVAFSPDGSTFANTGMADNTIPIRDVQTGELLKVLDGDTDLFCSVMYSPDGRTLAAGSLEGPIWVWNTQTGERLHTFTDPEFETHSLAYSPDSTILMSGSVNHPIHFWQVHSGQLLKTITENMKRNSLKFRANYRLKPYTLFFKPPAQCPMPTKATPHWICKHLSEHFKIYFPQICSS